MFSLFWIVKIKKISRTSDYLSSYILKRDKENEKYFKIYFSVCRKSCFCQKIFAHPYTILNLNHCSKNVENEDQI